ncbi:hypothetical protein [Rhodoferax sp. GW822-FHT02A01]|uniref:hypothetical protein n=1 Tax=Rhodoferax sp. GW822-FHT02A01 TaxID=3141537 RepID=UPI00315CB737
MEFIFEVLFEIFGELILQVLFEALAEVGIHLTRRHADAQPRSGWRLMIGYSVLGLIVGALSLLVFSHSLAHSHNGRLATLLLVPLLAALSTVLLGKLRTRKGQTLAGIDRFMYAYLFALGMASVRYCWAQ